MAYKVQITLKITFYMTFMCFVSQYGLQDAGFTFYNEAIVSISATIIDRAQKLS
jgi:hypothetical protein